MYVINFGVFSDHSGLTTLGERYEHIKLETWLSDVCIFGAHIDAALRGFSMKGGSELQAALIAKSLANHGITVTVVDPDALQSYQYVPNLTVESVPSWNVGRRGVRLFSHRIPNLVRCLRKTKARVYYARGFSFLHLILLYVARATAALFALGVASDMDLMQFSDRYRLIYRKNASPWRWLSSILPNEAAAAMLIRGSDTILVQHEAQRILAQGRARNSMLINNMLGDDVLGVVEQCKRKNFLWVGSFSSRKGLRTLLPVIEDLQHVVFEFVGAPDDAEARRVETEIRKYGNTILHGALDRRTTLERIAGAKALLNTSLVEGFPNTFLEAWALGTPVISLHVDPAGVIESHGLGYVCHGDLDLFKDLLQRQHYDIDIARVKDYVSKHHGQDQALRVFESLIRRSRMAVSN